MIIKQLNARILENKKIARSFYKMRIESTYLARNIKPGQFIEIRCSESLDPLLRRPFSVHRILKNGIEILYEVIGKGTEILSKRKSGEPLDILGPLGNGFDISLASRNSQLATIIVAGGIGVAPLVALAERLTQNKNVDVIIGAKTKSHILCETEFKSLGCGVKIATEDGSKGEEGLATDLLQGLLNAIRYPLYATIYACGPNAMLKEVARLAKAKRIPCQVSLDEYMACGIGVCLGCPVKVKGHAYKMVCKDGPIFSAEEIMW